MSDQQRRLGQYPTPQWVADALVERHFADLGRGDTVIEPSCGPGRFLQALPPEVAAVGVELDPQLAALAAQLTGRPIIHGDFTTVELDVEPTAIIGNPPFQLGLIDRFLERAHTLLPNEGRVGFILPAYAFQTAARVAGYGERWSITQEFIPRNIYQGLKLPLVFATFTKDRRRALVGFALYREATEVQRLPRRVHELLETATGSAWKAVVQYALEQLGGEAPLEAIYEVVAGCRPTENTAWQAQVRKVVRQAFRCTGPARYALAA